MGSGVPVLKMIASGLFQASKFETFFLALFFCFPGRHLRRHKKILIFNNREKKL